MTKNHIFTRPGSLTAHRLANDVNAINTELWTEIESQYQDMLKEKGGQELIDLEKTCSELGKILKAQRNENKGKSSLYLSRDDLFQFVHWKFGKGKKRNALWKHLHANSDDFVKECTQTSLQKALILENFDDADGMREVINELTQMKGVGPATASAILSFVRPDLFTFMDDEIIEALHPGKRDYTLKIYLEVNTKCRMLANGLGTGWDVRKVGYTLWTAARMCASGIGDLTAIQPEESSGKNAASHESLSSHASRPSRQKASKRQKLS